MDEKTAAEIIERLQRLETKVDTVIAFTGSLQNLVGVWMSGGRGKMLATLARMRGGDGQ